MKNTEKILTKGGKLSNYNYEPRVFFRAIRNLIRYTTGNSDYRS